MLIFFLLEIRRDFNLTERMQITNWLRHSGGWACKIIFFRALNVLLFFHSHSQHFLHRDYDFFLFSKNYSEKLFFWFPCWTQSLERHRYFVSLNGDLSCEMHNSSSLAEAHPWNFGVFISFGDISRTWDFLNVDHDHAVYLLTIVSKR